MCDCDDCRRERERQEEERENARLVLKYGAKIVGLILFPPIVAGDAAREIVDTVVGIFTDG
jgi:hypothetical protein